MRLKWGKGGRREIPILVAAGRAAEAARSHRRSRAVLACALDLIRDPGRWRPASGSGVWAETAWMPGGVPCPPGSGSAVQWSMCGAVDHVAVEQRERAEVRTAARAALEARVMQTAGAGRVPAGIALEMADLWYGHGDAVACLSGAAGEPA